MDNSKLQAILIFFYILQPKLNDNSKKKHNESEILA